MPVIRAVSYLLGGIVRLLFGAAARTGRAAGRAMPPPATDALRHVRRVHAASCAADTLVVLGVLRALLAPPVPGLRPYASLTALAAAALLAGAAVGVLRAGPRLAPAARYVPLLTLAGRAVLAWWLAGAAVTGAWWAAAGGLLALALLYRVGLAALLSTVAGAARDRARARVRVHGVVAGIFAAPLGLVALAMGPSRPAQLAFVLLILGLVPALRLPAPDDAAAAAWAVGGGRAAGAARTGGGAPGAGEHRPGWWWARGGGSPWPVWAAAGGWLALTVTLLVPLLLRGFRGSGGLGNGPLIAGGAAVAAGVLVGAVTGRWVRVPRWAGPAALLGTGALAAGALLEPALLALVCLAAAGTAGVLTTAADRAGGAAAAVGTALRAAAVPAGLAAGVWAVPAAAIAAAAVGALAGAVLLWPHRAPRDRPTGDPADRSGPDATAGPDAADRSGPDARGAAAGPAGPTVAEPGAGEPGAGGRGAGRRPGAEPGRAGTERRPVRRDDRSTERGDDRRGSADRAAGGGAAGGGDTDWWREADDVPERRPGPPRARPAPGTPPGAPAPPGFHVYRPSAGPPPGGDE
ncbi:hypothetical protein GCM10010123_27670 [Pilimelia anulata]|uniref:Uncharacterized protein n=1 Tax=Pilimelia anulata TaxID=53371 RepID=A0A8J3FA32_9ACTN|nr:hypothetical protein [Pilimelia anulata]GGJ96154.1 hypothetical protein GCM10010123_27670 [Pilimelia anulata]